MNASDFEEYLQAIRSMAWSRFKAQNSLIMNAITFGLPASLIGAYIFDEVAILSFVCLIASIILVIILISFGMSYLSFTSYVRSLIAYFRKRRKLIVVSNNYEQYLYAEASLKH